MSVPFKTASDRKKLVGASVVITMRSGRILRATPTESRGKNLCLDLAGSHDWIWVPDIANIKAAA